MLNFFSSSYMLNVKKISYALYPYAAFTYHIRVSKLFHFVDVAKDNGEIVY